MGALDKARNAARKAIESGYIGLCTIIERRNVRDEETKITHQREVVTVENQPCKLSFAKLQNAAQGENAAAVAQGVRLFIAPEVAVLPGSKIIVEQNGVSKAYAASGEPAVYSSHQEIDLALFRRWA